ncbi:sigma-70 family RNA polymerase sigma factor [Peribacillus butanolivorans]|uniref:sigma-70 family RNA polymerase sigma factor n=1 Tax=Peribacillus butanolivorans TaxID=421767 RepID=UPI0039FC4F32
MENEIDLDVDNKEIIIEDLMNMYSKDVYLLAYSFVKDQGLAEDISQEVFVKCYRNIEKFRRDASIKTWVYRITVNTCKDFSRKKSFRVLKYSKLFLEDFKKSESSEEIFLKQNQNAQILHKVLSLPKNIVR